MLTAKMTPRRQSPSSIFLGGIRCQIAPRRFTPLHTEAPFGFDLPSVSPQLYRSSRLKELRGRRYEKGALRFSFQIHYPPATTHALADVIETALLLASPEVADHLAPWGGVSGGVNHRRAVAVAARRWCRISGR